MTSTGESEAHSILLSSMPTTTGDKKNEKKRKKSHKKKKKGKKEASTDINAMAVDDVTLKQAKKSKKKDKKKKKKKKSDQQQGQKRDRSGVATQDTKLRKGSKKSRKQATACSSDVVAWRKSCKVSLWDCKEERITDPDPAWAPVTSFDSAPFPETFQPCWAKFDKPSVIQSQAWPILKCGLDMVGVAKTGSGKTLAFTLPGLLLCMDSGAGHVMPSMLVLAPTRELATQNHVVAAQAGALVGLRSVCIYGGVSKKDQVQALRKGVHVVVGTPGRLKDLLDSRLLDLSQVRYVVLDEADRMLDAGFEPDVRYILSATKALAQRQTTLFSATWPKSIRRLAKEFMKSPVRVTIGSTKLEANSSVKQIVEVVEDRARQSLLLGLLKRYHASRNNRIIIFVLYKKEASRIETFLQRSGWDCVSVHGDKSQSDREIAVQAFRENSVSLLVATDVASRGLDIPGVEVVINFSFPLTIEDYVHRIGRTGRAGKSGIAHTFFQQCDKSRAGELGNLLRAAGVEVPDALSNLGTWTKKKTHGMYGAHFREDTSSFKKASRIKFDD